MAGLRRLSGDPTLTVEDIQEYEIPHQRPSVGRVRGLRAGCSGEAGKRTFDLVLKEPLGTTRAGTAGAGLREVSVYRSMADQLPVRTPQLIAAHPAGDWMVLELADPGVGVPDWTADDYRLAIRSLVALHDRYWGLGRDLTVYNWLARPLDADFEIYLQAARNGLDILVHSPPPALNEWNPGFLPLLEKLVLHAAAIAGSLNEAPSTLLHGDYWPGNLQKVKSGELAIYDWQRASIGPGVLDLLHFVQSSRWWFAPIPLSVVDISQAYRDDLARLNGHRWDDGEWQELWDYGLLWTFIADWIDLLAAIPESLIETRLGQLEEIWLEPLIQAAARCGIPGI
jgi:hypothetical protein